MALDLGELHLRLLAMKIEDESYLRIMSPLSTAIEAASKAIASLGDTDEDWREAVIEDECEMLEHLLGIAFIVSQTQITSITSMALRARSFAVKTGKSFGGFSAPEGVRGLGEPLRPGCQYSKVEVIWAFANYYKHREEWNKSEWSKLTGQPTRTVPVIQAAGAKPGCSGNLRTGMETIVGSSDYGNLTNLCEVVEHWGIKVQEATAAGLT